LDAERPKFLQRQEQMLGGARESVKAPHYDCVKLPLASVAHQFIKFWARVFSAGLAYVNVFADKVKSSRRAVCA
jgi:hypothetical protein